MATQERASKEAVELHNSFINEHLDHDSLDADAEAVKELGLTATLPRSLKNIFSLIGLDSTIVFPWPATYFVAALSLGNGGTAGLLLSSILATIFMTAVYLSLAEKLRRFPTAGGQYHWVAALAPPRCRRFMSFFCGFLLSFTWLSTLMSATWLTALDITAIVLIHTGEYHVKWSFAIAASLCAVNLLVNCSWGKWINHLEKLALVVLVVAFFFVVGLLGSYAGANGTPTVSIAFTSSYGWGVHAATALGILYGAGALVGFDCASHVAEDTVDARKQLPRSLLTSAIVGGIQCIIISVMVVLCAGDVGQLFTGKLGASGHPLGSIVQLTYNAARGNKAPASVPFGFIAPLGILVNINTCAAASRLVYSLIRDDHNPAVQRVMAADLKRDQLPRITICLTALSPLLVLWINFLSSTGFQAIVSQVTLSIATTYLMAISCSLYSRFYHPGLLGTECKGIFQLGTTWGSINDVVALCYLLYVWILAWFPQALPVNSSHLLDLNYAPIIDAGVALLGVLYYVLYGREHYRNPAPKSVSDEVDADS